MCVLSFLVSHTVFCCQMHRPDDFAVGLHYFRSFVSHTVSFAGCFGQIILQLQCAFHLHVVSLRGCLGSMILQYVCFHFPCIDHPNGAFCWMPWLCHFALNMFLHFLAIHVCTFACLCPCLRHDGRISLPARCFVMHVFSISLHCVLYCLHDLKKIRSTVKKKHDIFALLD